MAKNADLLELYPMLKREAMIGKKKNLCSTIQQGVGLYKPHVKVALSLSSCIVLSKSKLLKQLKSTYDALKRYPSIVIMVTF